MRSLGAAADPGAPTWWFPIRTGFKPETTAASSCGQTAPGWCNWLPFADRFDACRVPTPEEIRACSSFGPALTPASRQHIEEETTRLWAAYCEMHPAECAEYEEATKPPVDWTKWALIAAAAIAALVLIGRR